MYDAIADPYCYNGTTILKNLASIRKQAALTEFEAAPRCPQRKVQERRMRFPEEQECAIISKVEEKPVMTSIHRLGVTLAAILLSGCAGYAGDSYGYSSDSAGYSSSSSSSSSSDSDSRGEARESSHVDRRGNIVFRDGNETTVVRPDGGVTIIQRDSDGTRTYVDSDGDVRVKPPRH